MRWKLAIGACLCCGLILWVMNIAWSEGPVRAAKPSPKKETKPPRRTTQQAKAGTSYLPAATKHVLIQGATVWTADAKGQVLKSGDVRVRDGKIAEVGHQLAPKGAFVVKAKGRILTPGLIDTHSHMGVYPSVGLRATADGNEWTRPVTAYVWAEHSVWTQDPAFPKAVAGGATTVQILPGSANLIGGRSVILKLKLKRSVHEMKFPGAVHGLKMACGENPKRVHRSLATRMGNYAGYRRAFLKAKAYLKKWTRYHKKLAKWKVTKKQKEEASSQPTTKKAKAKKAKEKKRPKPPRKDINMETLKQVLEGKILVHIHCYRAEEMIWMIRLSKEFGFKIRSFHHAVEAYKIRDILKKENISVSTWADWWGFKLEAFDGIQENAALVHAAGGRAIIHSDSATGVQRLNHEAGKALYRGRAMGLKISDQEALKWITMHPAWALGIHHQTGSIEVGKMADLVLWDGHPFSVYTKTAMVWIDGLLTYDRRWPNAKTDFTLGLLLK